MSVRAARKPFYPCMSCSHSTVYDWDTRMVRCELSGESGQAGEVDCLSYAKRNHIIDFAELARKKEQMSATDDLRRLLDERGVEYETADGWWTSWDTAGALNVDAAVYCEDLGSGLEIRWHTITPEQAITATLGSGTCKLEETESYSSERGIVHVLECSNCGQECEHVNGDYEYCPHCLAKNELF